MAARLAEAAPQESKIEALQDKASQDLALQDLALQDLALAGFPSSGEWKG
jgi:hypothetical protein